MKRVFFYILPLLFLLPTLSHAALVSRTPTDRATLGLAAYWTFDGSDIVSGLARDRIGGYDGTPTNNNATFFRPGKIGQAFNFDGSDDRVFVGGPAVSTTHTISLWLNVQGLHPTKNWSALVVNGSSPYGGIYFKNDTNNISYYYGADHLNNTPITLNKWHHIVVVTSSGNVTFYIDGVMDGNASGAPSLIMSQIGNNNANEALVGLMDDVRVYDRALTAAEVKQLNNIGSGGSLNSSGKEASGYLAGYWTFDGPDLTPTSVFDRSRHDIPGTLTGFSSLKTAMIPGKLGQALIFNGSSDYITMDDVAEPGTISLAAWVKPAVVKTGMKIISKKMSGAGAQYGLATHGSNADKFTSVFFSSSPASDVCVSTGAEGTYTANKWYFVVATYDGDVCKMYVNGVDVTTVTSDTASGDILDTSSVLRVGAEGGATPAGFFTGALDEVRIYTKALSPAEVVGLYTSSGGALNISSSKNNSQTKDLVGLWSFDGPDMFVNVADKSGLRKHGFMRNFTSTTTATRPGRIGQALIFDGVNDFVHLPNVTYAPGTGDFTASVWIRPTNTNTEVVFATDLVNGNNFWLGKSSTGAFSINGILLSAGSLTLNKWHHLVGVRRAGNMYIYVNGVEVGGPVASAGTITTTNYTIGVFNSAAPEFQYAGTADDVRLYSRALSASEIGLLYNLGR